MSELTDSIRSKGYWDITIRPDRFEESRVKYEDLDTVLERAVVRLRGWPMPYIDGREDFIRQDTWTGQDLAPGHGPPEAWRFFTSGQFSHLRGLPADWRPDEYVVRHPDGAEAIIEVWEILFTLTEVFELAGQLALTPAGDDQMTIQVELHGLRNRALVVAQTNRAEFYQPRISSMDAFPRSVTLSRDELVAEPRAHAVELARDMFLRFGFNASIEQLTGHQAEIDS